MTSLIACVLASLALASAYLRMPAVHVPRSALLRSFTPIRSGSSSLVRKQRAHALIMCTPPVAQMLEFLEMWDEDEDGDPDNCTTMTAFEFLADRVDEHHELLPALEEVFDAVLGECDEACVRIDKMKEYLVSMQQ
mmetsp:Transcript_53110/g.121980  ORF Transcript_53110/g.121980 Transcript_53110/m.121980 type:complete len:136 (-) Transcript_53110:170-577(-)|eukprot:CAMPEP_0119380638 /NCGR_PEP_ID=MMETSP1334-20130426/57838_1 /TAXON_ID=127549 /ORGANISM="Calcidiscus leptoporus, Strain RCC1130" /LENGTH=135 /DNA_ID=CAMNT_0007400555 /DNA_START=13 /DNA_END=420 /DNA_ORIENTATION=+